MRRLLPVLLLAAGCNLYFDTGDDVCALVDVAPAQELRDPSSGECVPFGFGGGCDCGPCPAGAEQAFPDWGTCFSECEALDEVTCALTSGCRAAYHEFTNTDRHIEFMGCWAVAPSGPVQGGACAGLDAYECSRHDDCSAWYGDTIDGPTRQLFQRCEAELGGKGCYSTQDCGGGEHCSVDDGECLPPPGCDPAQGCPAVCYGRCLPDNDSCAAVDCGPGTHCEEQCYPCDSQTPGGSCDPYCQPMCVPDQCNIACPPGSQCVQVCDPMGGGGGTNCGTCHNECLPVGGACETLANESDCANRADCRAVYQGDDCTCYENGVCECKILTYERCETR
jgi:hypothetical protein